MPSTARAPRRDAARNRERLLEAAATAFRERGLDASVNAIARDAGVNVATLYRHFPTKDHLVAAVLDALLAPIATARDRALERDDDVLATFLREAAGLQHRHSGLADALGRETVRARLRGPAIDIVAPIVERAHADGDLREEFGAIDLLLALKMIGAVAGRPALVDVVLRGLR